MGIEKLISVTSSAETCQPVQEAESADTQECEASKLYESVCVSVHLIKSVFRIPLRL